MRFARLVLRLFGWRVVDNLPPGNKYILVGAWHTSNWDFPLAIFAMWGLGVKLHFIGKQELISGRLGFLMKRLGVIGVDRSKTVNFVQKMAELFKERDELRLVLAAEGTRSQAEYWKTGFYYMALAAQVPIAFGFIDARAKEVGIDGYFMPTGNRDEDLHKVKLFFESKQGLKPHKQGSIKFKVLEPAPEEVPD
ncbi:MAG: 1-acyl-sn-glycerol-3-phosphate acyltransferase [Trueperaceae bacterium]|nr:1-acyl-sn-glycerol-3-phosphate acyltransferase [Trueperaceae bacterium]